jgi:hypothetical protein
MTTIVQPVIERSGQGARSYVEWSAVIAGAVLASAISFTLLTFGTGIGLSLTSPYPGESVTVTGFAIALGLWVLWVSTSSFFAGGYLAGRMRARIGDATEHEVEVRDAVHGLLVWAASVLLGALIAYFTAAGVASKSTDVAVTGATAVASQATDSSPLAYWADVIMRSGTAPSAATGGATGAGAVAVPGSGDEIRRIFSSANAEGQISADDRTYLSQLVARNTGLSEADAQARVDTVLQNVRTATEEARRLAEQARKFAVLMAFLTAATIAVGAAAAWFAAGLGGKHRDQGTNFGAFFGRR